jgi:CRISPR-associated protein Csm4
MEYSLYRLNFTTCLHIGRDTGAVSLDSSRMAIHADTLFAALCCEAAGDERLGKLVEYFTEGTLAISDALPYAGDELFLPRPVLFTGNRRREGDAVLKKALKGLEYIPLSLFGEYLRGLNQAEVEPDKLKACFGQQVVTTRVALKGKNPPLPYHLAAWRFATGCGLYIIACWEQEAAGQLLASLLTGLGLTGIGGKQSSGWGKFEVSRDSVPTELLKLLKDEEAPYQMLLGTALPPDSELDEVLEDGWYSLVRRGGFIRSATYSPGQLKKRTIYMLAPGSCLRRRFKGGMFDLSDNGAHPVWRCGNSLFVGVNL